MWTFLKQIFKKEKEVTILNSDDAESWFQSKVEERIANLDGPIQAFYESIRTIQQQLRDQREALRSAEIQDPEKVEARIKSIVLGHRDNYIRELGIFLNNIELPDETSVEKSQSFYNALQDGLTDLAEKTAKSFGASQHLFHKETDAVTASLKELSLTLASFHSILEKQGIIKIEEVKKKINEISKIKEQQKNKTEKHRLITTRLESAHKQKNAKEHEIITIKQSKEHDEYNQLKERKETIVDQRAAIERDIAHLFLDVDRALRKYSYLALADEKSTIENYLSDPKNALLEDTELVIWDIFTKLNNSISSLELKPEQEESLKNILLQLNKERLLGLRTKYKDALAERQKIITKLENNPAESKIKEAEYKRDHFKEQIGRFEKEEEELANQLTGFTIDEKYAELSKQMSEALDVPIEIKPSA